MNEPKNNVDLASFGSAACSENESTDDSLVALVCSGDETAFEKIFERHRLRVARIIGRFFCRREKVEEILQEVFTKLYFALRSYSSEQGSSFAAWLSSIAINSCYDELRRAKRRPESSISEVTEEESSWLNAKFSSAEQGRNAESQMISRDLAEKLLGRLNAEDRLVLTLLDAQDLSVSDIAEITGWSVSKVKVRAHRARATLRKVLGEYI
jgi:RNA polymerase sigma-70 factor, ECF subfamily